MKVQYLSTPDIRVLHFQRVLIDILKKYNIQTPQKYLKKLVVLRPEIERILPENSEIIINKELPTYEDVFLNVQEILKEIKAEETIVDFQELVLIDTQKREEEENDIRNSIRTGENILDKGVPPIEWVVENIVRKGGITIFGGTAGTMKTFTALYLALCCANNLPFLYEYKTKQSKILYIDEENGDIVIANRLQSMINGMGLKKENAKDVSFSIFNNFKLDIEEVIIKLKYIITRHQPDLIIFDSMVRCMEGEEDKSKDVRLIFDHLKEIFNEFGTSFILLHHTAKGQKGLNALRGSGDFAGMADVVMMFDKLKDGSIRATFEKNRHIDTNKLGNFNFNPNYNEEENKFNFQFLGINTESVSKRDECKTELLDFAQEKGVIGFKTKEAIQAMNVFGYSRQTFYDALKLLIDEDTIQKTDKKGFYIIKNKAFVGEEKIN